ncbi:hypothetical protein FH609_003705 [Streptomyces sp. 3MP-14]|uniref:Uncharacterized protein n=1 Tax=Streptomyces mimosae TaxID=2586635 RepID=A0A5N6A559_9ACTN|nr:MULTISPECIES: hypothetical protein [Streptomyces]KAB8162850.1 hypothetical protein FH607_019570 [Streptomyces mimosae]KAB8179063.1 hypothetical protein FH609_003705 [Streptomyces sp. 3MP-14]
MADTVEHPTPPQGGTGPNDTTDRTAEVIAHAIAGTVLRLQRLSPERQAETALGAQSSGSCGVTSCIFDPA